MDGLDDGFGRGGKGIAFAEDVFKLYDRGVLRGWSIGFVPRKAHRTPTPNGSSLYVREWDLLEYSAVPIPENPGAVTVAIAIVVKGASSTTP